MTKATAPQPGKDTASEDLGNCANHPELPAVAQTDGGGVHELLSFCRACWRTYEATRPKTRK